MKFKYLFCLGAACFTLSLFAQNNTTSSSDKSGNPIFKGWYADPEGVVFGDECWIYPTYSAAYDEQTFMDAFSSKDLDYIEKVYTFASAFRNEVLKREERVL